MRNFVVQGVVTMSNMGTMLGTFKGSCSLEHLLDKLTISASTIPGKCTARISEDGKFLGNWPADFDLEGLV